MGFEPWLFLREEHLSLQSSLAWRRFYIVSKSKKIVAGHIPFLIDDRDAVSPFKAPFGSLECMEKLPPKVIYDFLEYAIGELTSSGVEKIVIRNPPENYTAELSAVISTCLFNLGFNAQSEVNTYLRIGDLFEKEVNTWQQRKLRKCKEAGLSFQKLEMSQNEINRIYTFILECRNERSYHLSIDLATLQKSCQVFPNRYHLFSVLYNGKLCAASVAVDVGNHILYNFISAHPREFDSMSPVVMLMKGMYEFCQDNNFEQLDLGTSAIDGKPNFSLLNFKLGLGGIPSSKFTFTREL